VEPDGDKSAVEFSINPTDEKLTLGYAYNFYIKSTVTTDGGNTYTSRESDVKKIEYRLKPEAPTATEWITVEKNDDKVNMDFEWEEFTEQGAMITKYELYVKGEGEDDTDYKLLSSDDSPF